MTNFKSVTNKLKFLDRIENSVRKEENADYQALPPLPTMFSEGLFLRVLKTWYCLGQGFT